MANSKAVAKDTVRGLNVRGQISFTTNGVKFRELDIGARKIGARFSVILPADCVHPDEHGNVRASVTVLRVDMRTIRDFLTSILGDQ